MQLLQNNFLRRISIRTGDFSVLKKIILSGGLFLVFFFITPNLAFATVTGQQAYTTPGTYSWTCPAGVTSVSVVAVGGGGGSSNGAGGGGGALAYANNITVVPGNTYSVVVGVAGDSSGQYGTGGGASNFVSYANAGGGQHYGSVAGGTVAAGTGYPGGAGASSRGGGGGAGGYFGAGGAGNSPSTGGTGFAGTGGSGGGGSGGDTGYPGGGGGGVGLTGQGSSGSGGSYTYPNNIGAGGGGGSSGSNGGNGSGVTGGGGGAYGGGAGGSYSGASNPAAVGAVRIIWPGTTRSFPSTNTVDMTNTPLQSAFTTPGTYTWTAPAGVTSVSVVAVGNGGNGVAGSGSPGSGGGGGGLGYKNNYTVVPGNTYTVVVGGSAVNSYFVSTSVVKGGAASGSTGGSYTGDGGGNGGTGGNSLGAGGGGGAGGYSGNGGNANTAGTGGGGGGGLSYTEPGGGGGVGILGQGSNGAAGTSSLGGGGGSSGTAGTVPFTRYALGGTYGGGGSGWDSGTYSDGTSTGGSGAVRIIWGTSRSFPSTNTGDLYSYDITSSAGSDGSISPSGVTSVTQGSSQTFTITPSTTGYVVSTVLVDGVDQGAIGSYTFTNVQAAHTISATFTVGSYGVTWNSATGGSSSGVATCTYGATVTPTCTPSTGYSTASCASFTCSTSNSFTPSFSINSYTVTFNTNTGDGGSMGTQSLVYNTPTALTTNGFTKTGYTFAGWNTAADGSGTAYANSASYTIGAAAVTLYAKWTANSYTVTFDTNGGGGGATAPQSLVYNTPTALTSNGFTKTGYTFAGWATTAGGSVAYTNGASYTIGAANVTLYAQWTVIPYTLTIPASGGNGSGAYSGTAAGSVNYGTAVSITATPAASSNFTSWTATGAAATACNGSAVSPCAFTMTGVASVTANYTLKTYTLTYTAGANGTLTGTASQTVNYGANGSAVTAVPNTGYSFSNWSDAVGTAARTDSSITANKSVTASFSANSYTVTFDTNTGDGGSTGAQSLVYNTPTALTTNGFTKTGYTFAGWATTAGGTVAYTNGASYTIGAAAVTLYAKWTINSYTVTFDTNGGNGGSTATQSLVYNTPTALTTNGFTLTDYSFSGWNTVADGSGTTYANEANYTIGTAGVTLYAQWTINPYISSGTFTSSVMDLGPTTNATTLSYSTTLNGQTITIDVRAGNTATPDDTWSAWQTGIAEGGSLAALASYRYVQYRANFSTSDTGVTPTLDSVTINTGYNTYTLTLPASGGVGAGSYSGTSAGPVAYGTGVIVTATPDTGSSFTTWTATGAASACNGSAVNPCTFAMTGVASVTANYAISTYTLTVTTGANGSASGPSGTYNYGQVVTLTATPNANYYLVSWTGDADCSDGSVTMTADVSCTANFATSASQDPVTGASVSSSGSNQATLSWTNPPSPGSTIIIVRSLSPITTAPTNGAEYYSVGSNIDVGTSVVYAGGASTFVDSGLTGGFSYYYKIFTKNLLQYSTGVSPIGSPVTVSGSAPAINQIGYIWRIDDSLGSSAVSQNTNLSSGVYVGDRRRLRFQIANGSAYAANGYNYRLEYSVANPSCTVWNSVPVLGTYTNQPWLMDISPYIRNGVAISHYSGLTTQAGSFAPGLFNSSSNETTVISIPTNSYSEFEYSLKSTSNSVPGGAYCFRLTNGGSTNSFTYSSIPQIILQGVSSRPETGGGSLEAPSTPSGAVNGGSGGGGTPTAPNEIPAPVAPPVQGTPSGSGGNGGGDVGIIYNGMNGLAAVGNVAVQGILRFLLMTFSTI